MEVWYVEVSDGIEPRCEAVETFVDENDKIPLVTSVLQRDIKYACPGDEVPDLVGTKDTLKVVVCAIWQRPAETAVTIVSFPKLWVVRLEEGAGRIGSSDLELFLVNEQEHVGGEADLIHAVASVSRQKTKRQAVMESRFKDDPVKEVRVALVEWSDEHCRHCHLEGRDSRFER